MTYNTPIEKYFERLRRLMRKQGYGKEDIAMQSLAKLRKALKDRGFSFEPTEEVTEAANV